ncbi:MAG: 4'-phosphopantetheinyl transferase family protein [Pseudomonadota bacterium]
MEPLDVDVVHWHLSRQQGRLGDLRSLLAPDELARAERLALPAHRARFVLARGLLRHTLGAFAGRDPAALRFAVGEHGKPSLIDGSVDFNMAHAGDGLVIAVTQGGTVGCDLEPLRPVPQAAAIARQWFSPAERQWMNELSGVALDRAFLSCWVRKEAVLKALGTGLQAPLAFTAGPADPDGLPCRLTVAGRDCWLVDLALRPGYAAAVAADRPIRPAVLMPDGIEALHMRYAPIA